MPGLIDGALRTHFVRFSWLTGDSTPAIFGLLAMCVSSGPTFPAAVVPFTVWHPEHAPVRNAFRPTAVFGSFRRFASATAVMAHVAYSLWGCATTVMSMSACPSPQNSKHWPLNVPGWSAWIQTKVVCPGTASFLPPRFGTQNECVRAVDLLRHAAGPVAELDARIGEGTDNDCEHDDRAREQDPVDEGDRFGLRPARVERPGPHRHREED